MLPSLLREVLLVAAVAVSVAFLVAFVSAVREADGEHGSLWIVVAGVLFLAAMAYGLYRSGFVDWSASKYSGLGTENTSSAYLVLSHQFL